MKIQLDTEVIGPLVVERGVHPGIARQSSGIAIVDVALVLISESDTDPDAGRELDKIPEREHIFWQLPRPQTVAPQPIRLLTVEIAIRCGQIPRLIHLPLQLNLETVNFRFNDIQCRGVIVCHLRGFLLYLKSRRREA